jgi:hypothetical protein
LEQPVLAAVVVAHGVHRLVKPILAGLVVVVNRTPQLVVVEPLVRETLAEAVQVRQNTVLEAAVAQVSRETTDQLLLEEREVTDFHLLFLEHQYFMQAAVVVVFTRRVVQMEQEVLEEEAVLQQQREFLELIILAVVEAGIRGQLQGLRFILVEMVAQE